MLITFTLSQIINAMRISIVQRDNMQTPPIIPVFRVVSTAPTVPSILVSASAANPTALLKMPSIVSLARPIMFLTTQIIAHALITTQIQTEIALLAQLPNSSMVRVVKIAILTVRLAPD
jgi:hypothetical protein